jgi:hypothetical protein
MLGNLQRAALMFGVTVTGTPVHGWRLRSASATATGPGGPRWLRVGTERESDLPHPCWDGLPTANDVIGVPKPIVLDSAEWPAHDRPVPRRVRADVMTLLTGHPCSPDEVLRHDPELPDTWWGHLRDALITARDTPTSRRGGWSRDRVAEMFGAEVAEQAQVTETETTHGDLHWANLLGPQLGILDWEMWGRAPLGTDPASLYCYTLLVPTVAARVWDTFTDVLDTRSGRAALLRVAARLLRRAPREFPDLAEPLREQVHDLAGSVSG